MNACSHPPTRYYTWWAYNCLTNKKDWLVICGRDCGTCLKGSNEEFESLLQAHEQQAQGRVA